MKFFTMVDTAKDFLGHQKSVEFDAIFDKVKEVLFDSWRAETPTELSDVEIINKKRGELYKLLTIDSRFFRNNDGTWTAIRPDTLGRE